MLDHASPVDPSRYLQSHQYYFNPDHCRYGIYHFVSSRCLSVNEIEDNGINPRRGNVSTAVSPLYEIKLSLLILKGSFPLDMLLF